MTMVRFITFGIVVYNYRGVMKMTRIEKLEQDIQKLTRQELAALREWFRNYDADEWDQQIEEDVNSGKLEMLAKEALADYKTGKVKNL